MDICSTPFSILTMLCNRYCKGYTLLFFLESLIFSFRMLSTLLASSILMSMMGAAVASEDTARDSTAKIMTLENVDVFAETLVSSLHTSPKTPFTPFLPKTSSEDKTKHIENFGDQKLTEDPNFVTPPEVAEEKVWDTNSHGYDISWPQCGGTKPSGPKSYAIIGVTGGKAFTLNPCLKEQWDWAEEDGVAGYVNINSLKATELQKWGKAGPYGNCEDTDWGCLSRNAGYAEVDWALDRAKEMNLVMPTVWLDVETLNYWTDDPAANRWLIEGAIFAAKEHGVTPGLYTTRYMWAEITNNWDPQLITWRPVGESNRFRAENACTENLAYEKPVMVQWVEGNFDNNILCPTNISKEELFATK